MFAMCNCSTFESEMEIKGSVMRRCKGNMQKCGQWQSKRLEKYLFFLVTLLA